MNGRPNQLAPVAILGFLLAFALLTATTARASVTPCPAVPDTYTPSDPPTDTDAIVAELRELRRENAVTCDAIRSGTVDTRDAVTATDARDAIGTADTHITDAIGDIPAPADSGTESTPAVVKLANSDSIQAQAVAGFNSIHELLWFIGGLLVASIAIPLLRKVIWP